MYLSKQAQNWMPNWVLKHPALLAHTPQVKVFQEQLGLEDFRTDFTNELAHQDLKHFLKTEFSNLLKALYLQSPTYFREVERVILLILNQLANPVFWQKERLQLTSTISSTLPEFSFPIHTSIVKVYQRIVFNLQQQNIEMADLISSQAFKNFGKRGKMILVFSTQVEDVLAMSSRSLWGSCQTLSTTKRENVRVIGSALSNYLGILYLTQGKDFQERGEKILHRCLCRFAYDTQNNFLPVLLIDQMYPSFDLNLINLILQKVLARVKVPVYSVDLLETKKENHNRFLLPDEDIPGLKTSEKSFIDASHLYRESLPQKKY